MRFHTPEDALVLPIPQDARPPAGAGIAQARPIRYRDMLHYLGMLLKKLKLVG